MAISTNQKPTIYRNLYKSTGPGLVLFTFYTTPLSAVLSGFNINHNLYTDDTQMYMSLSVSNAKESPEKLQHYFTGVSAWMTGSKLKPEHSKTEFLLTGTKLQR